MHLFCWFYEENFKEDTFFKGNFISKVQSVNEIKKELPDLRTEAPITSSHNTQTAVRNIQCASESMVRSPNLIPPILLMRQLRCHVSADTMC